MSNGGFLLWLQFYDGFRNFFGNVCFTKAEGEKTCAGRLFVDWSALFQLDIHVAGWKRTCEIVGFRARGLVV